MPSSIRTELSNVGWALPTIREMAGGARPTLLNADLDLERIRLFSLFARPIS